MVIIVKFEYYYKKSKRKVKKFLLPFQRDPKVHLELSNSLSDFQLSRSLKPLAGIAKRGQNKI